MPAWIITHNRYHHRSINAQYDAHFNRRFTHAERSRLRSGYTFLLFPTIATVR